MTIERNSWPDASQRSHAARSRLRMAKGLNDRAQFGCKWVLISLREMTSISRSEKSTFSGVLQNCAWSFRRQRLEMLQEASRRMSNQSLASLSTPAKAA